MPASTFYVLPPRPVVEQQLASGLEALLPGIPWTLDTRAQMVESLFAVLSAREDVFLVSRDELPAGEPVQEALRSAFGAEPGDEVVELRFAARGQAQETRRWRI